MIQFSNEVTNLFTSCLKKLSACVRCFSCSSSLLRKNVSNSFRVTRPSEFKSIWWYRLDKVSIQGPKTQFAFPTSSSTHTIAKKILREAQRIIVVGVNPTEFYSKNKMTIFDHLSISNRRTPVSRGLSNSIGIGVMPTGAASTALWKITSQMELVRNTMEIKSKKCCHFILALLDNKIVKIK